MAITRIANIASTIPDDSIANVKMSNIVQSKNIIINGGMDISQRGTSFTGLTNGSSDYTVDRFRFNESGSMTSVFTFSQDTDVPSGQGFAKSLKIQNTTAGSGHNVIEAIQYIEAQNLQYLKFGTSSAESLTLSFWVKCSETGTGNIALYNLDSTRMIAKNYTISSANTWEKITLTFPGDTSGSFNNDNGAGLAVFIPIAAAGSYNTGTPGSWGSYSDGLRGAGMTIDLTNSTSDNIYITGLQLEAGTTASDFEFLPVDVNLERCQRYFETNMSYGVTPANPVSDADANIYGSAGAFASSACRLDHFFLTRKRTSPSMTFYNVNNLSGSVDAGKWQIYDGGWSQSTSATATGAANQNMVNIQINDTFTVGNIYLVAGGLTADAEL